MAEILPPTSGRLRVAGFDLETETVEAKRRLAFMPDERRLFEYLTVADHLALSARLYQVAGAAETTRTLLEESLEPLLMGQYPLEQDPSRGRSRAPTTAPSRPSSTVWPVAF